ncbi:MAG: rRNA pseudouridine synthase, partial [Ruminococcus sp.]|nr:rRNA pseudouridine synthase [Ruminococcus sp.]
MSSMRIDRFISERSEYTRSEIKNLVSKKLVSADGTIIKKSDFKVNPE